MTSITTFLRWLLLVIIKNKQALWIGVLLLWISLFLSYQKLHNPYNNINQPIATGGFPIKTFDYPIPPMGSDWPPTASWYPFLLNFAIWLVVGLVIFFLLKNKLNNKKLVTILASLAIAISIFGLFYIMFLFD